MKMLEAKRMEMLRDKQPNIFLPTDIDYTLEDAMEDNLKGKDKYIDNEEDSMADDENFDLSESSYRFRKRGRKNNYNFFMMMMFNAEIWNVRGLNADGKITTVSDMLKKYCPDTIALSETKKEDFSPGCLKSLANFHDFEWNWLRAIGTAGGILVGINLEKFEILSWYKKKYCVMVSLKNETDIFIWNFVVVYGMAYEEHKQEFLDELSSLTIIFPLFLEVILTW
jgi:hypothetical protein